MDFQFHCFDHLVWLKTSPSDQVIFKTSPCLVSYILLDFRRRFVNMSSHDRPDFFSKVRFGWSAPIKSEKKLKGRFISINHLLVIEIRIFVTRDNLKGYVPTKSNLALLWQWSAAWKPWKTGSHVSWRGLCALFRIFYSRYFKLVVLFPEYFICHATETDLKIESAELQHKPANKFSQKEFHSIKLKTIF